MTSNHEGVIEVEELDIFSFIDEQELVRPYLIMTTTLQLGRRWIREYVFH